MFSSLCVMLILLNAYLSAWLVDYNFKFFFRFVFYYADELNVHFHPESSQPTTYMFERRQKLDMNYIM